MSDENNIDLEAQKADFEKKCWADVDFTKKAVAAVLSKDEIKLVFLFRLEAMGHSVTYLSKPVGTYMSQSYSSRKGYGLDYLNAICAEMSQSAATGQTPNAATDAMSYATGGHQPLQHLNVATIMTDGENWEFTGLLPAAGQILAKVPMGIIITALIQALFGTKFGAPLLVILLAL